MNAQSAGTRPSPLRHSLAVAVLGILACATAATANAQASARADEVRAYNAQVLNLQSQLHRGAAGSQAAAVLAARATALRSLMATDPTAAEKLAFPVAVLEQLATTFPNQAMNLEQRGRWEGELEFTIEDGVDLKSHRAIYRLHRGQEVLDVRFSGSEPPVLRSGRKLAVSGVRSGRQVVASEVEVMDAAMDGTDAAAANGASCGPTGPQNVVTVLVNTPTYKLSSGITPDLVRGALLGNAFAGTSQATPDISVSDFWEQHSDDRTKIDPAFNTVIGPIQLNSDFNKDSTGASFCDYYGLADAAMKAVDGQVNFQNYTRVQFVLPPNGACSWAGVANVGCRSLSSGDGTFTGSMAWLRADTMGSRGRAVQLITHEMGHNLGLSHASSRDFGAEPLGAVGANGSLSEYGDPTSTMGTWNYGFYAASHAANQLGWLNQGSNYLTVESSGTYTIQNYEGRPAGVKALKVRRGTGNTAWLWVESRQKTGLYSSTLDATLFTGALIHYEDSSTGGKSHLLDFTPATTSFTDAALPVGQTWTDPYSNVSVTVASVTPAAMTVQVNYGAVPCVTAAPTVTASPTGASTEYGSTARFNVSVKNNDSSSCSSKTFALGATGPSDWSKTLGTSSFTLAPGQNSTTTLDFRVPAPYALGTYQVAASASSTSGNASAVQNVTVIEPVNRLSLSVSGTGSVSFSSPVKTCTSSCATDYAKSTTPTVTLTATPGNRMTFTGWGGACSGTQLTCTVTVGSNLSVTASFGKSGSTGGGKGGGKPTK
jgi:M6 family metalloprotease-like protein